MKSTTIIIVAAIVAVGGRWARQKTIDTRIVVGGIFMAVIVSLISEGNEPLAEKFAWLILLSVAGANADDLLKAIGTATMDPAQLKNATKNAKPGG